MPKKKSIWAWVLVVFILAAIVAVMVGLALDLEHSRNMRETNEDFERMHSRGD